MVRVRRRTPATPAHGRSRPVPGDGRIVGHILRLERRDADSCRASARHSPVTIMLLPASDVAPPISSARSLLTCAVGLQDVVFAIDLAQAQTSAPLTSGSPPAVNSSSV